jgi:hypothetical protein
VAKDGDKQKVYPTKQELKDGVREIKSETRKAWTDLKKK